MGFWQRFFSMEKGTLENIVSEGSKYDNYAERITTFSRRNGGFLGLSLGIPVGLYVQNAVFNGLQKYNRWCDLVGQDGMNDLYSSELGSWIFGLAAVGGVYVITSYLSRMWKTGFMKDKLGLKRRESWFKRSWEVIIPGVIAAYTGIITYARAAQMKSLSEYFNNPELLELAEDVLSYEKQYLLFGMPFMYLLGRTILRNFKISSSSVASFKQYFKQTPYVLTLAGKKLGSIFMSSKNYDKLVERTKKMVEVEKLGDELKPRQQILTLTYSTDPINRHKLLEDLLVSIKQEQDASKVYLKDNDIDTLILLFADDKETDINLYGAALLEKDASHVSKKILNELSKSESFYSLTAISLYKSIFGHVINPEEAFRLIDLIRTGEGEHREFVGAEKTAVQYFDGEAWRVWKHSENDFHQQFEIEKALFNRLRKEPNITTEFSLFYLLQEKEHHSLSLRLKGNNLEEEIRNSSDQESILLDTLRKAEQYLASLDDVSRKIEFDAPDYDISSMIERRVVGQNRFIKTPEIVGINNKIIDYIHNAFGRTPLTNIDADLSDQNTFYDKITGYYSFFDPRVQRGNSNIALAKLVVQTNCDLEINKKRKILIDVTSLDPEQASIAMLYHLLCEAGSDLGHNRENHYFLRKINDIKQLAPSFEFGKDLMEYLRQHNYAA